LLSLQQFVANFINLLSVCADPLGMDMVTAMRQAAEEWITANVAAAGQEAAIAKLRAAAADTEGYSHVIFELSGNKTASIVSLTTAATNIQKRSQEAANASASTPKPKPLPDVQRALRDGRTTITHMQNYSNAMEPGACQKQWVRQ
jgi:hypothetical protein